jgi:hypothetical protein
VSVAEAPTPAPAPTRRATRRVAGVEANELLTSAVAAVLTILLLAEGVTLVDFGALLGPHMFIGLMLIPPVALKLASTGYRFARYYTGAAVYREKGPPRLPLRVLAPLLVASTVTIFASGVWLLLIGHHSDLALAVHKVAFIVWSGVFGVHFLAYLPTAARALAGAAVPRTGRRSIGSWLTGMVVAGSLGAGLALAIALLARIGTWHGGSF